MITTFISLIQLAPYNKTILTKKDSMTVNKRFLPSDKMVTIAQKIGPQQQNNSVISNTRKFLIPQRNYITSYGLYQPKTTTILCRPLLYDHRSSMNNKIISNPNIKFTSLLENTKIDLLFEEARKNVNVQKYLEILDDIKLKTFIKTNFSPENLRNILTDLQKIEVSLERKQEILYNLQKYFKNNPPTIEDAELFLELWYKNDCVFTALDFKVHPEPGPTSEKNTNSNTNKNKSLEDKKKIIMSNMFIMDEQMKKDFISFETEPTKILLFNIIQNWSNYLNNRSNALPLQPAEIEINHKLDLLWKTFAPSPEKVLAKINDNLKTLKEHSTLDDFLKQDIIKKSFTIDDYKNEIEYINNALNFLKICGILSEHDIKILTINSSAAIIDAEGTFKLTHETYQSFPENKNALGFSYTENKPKIDYILTQIKEKKYVIVNEYKNKPNSVIDISYLGHKTLVINDNNTSKKIRIGLLTSTNDENTFLLDDYQQTNPDIDKQNKKQYFRILSHFIIVEENEPLLVDMETTLFLHHVNSDNKDITEILLKFYVEKTNIWSNNNYQISYNANEDFIKKIAIIFYKKKLQMLEEGLKELEEDLEKLNPQEKLEKLHSLNKKKLKYMEDKKFQQYISLLPLEYQVLYKTITLFNIKKQKDDIRKEKIKFKQKIEDSITLKKTNKENETKIKTAKNKKDDYLKNKQKLLDEQNS